MARTSTITKIGKRQLELSNLKKVLFPEDHFVKAELIEYYLRIAPTILRHIKGRPLSLVRFPDGIDGEQFFQKNRPTWAPDWIDHIALGDEDKVDYILATEEATLVWLANLACIELHQMHCRTPHYDKPDYIVYDLDPPPGYPFKDIVTMAFDLRKLVESYGYHTFVKTTGGKGVHILTPIEPKWDFGKAHDTAEEIAKVFVAANSKTATLQVKKDARQGKVFVDIHRNRTYQTIVSPYSVRGRRGALVSMPLHWEELATVTDPGIFNIKSVPDRVISDGDPWETLGAYAVPLHTDRRSQTKSEKANPDAEIDPTLAEYARKRTFSMTPEPGPEFIVGEGNAFVVHRHHASRLHYDLRIEREGTLKCWAVPRGLPPRPGIKRLAVATEDHPLKYLKFEGTIPKGQYGGGDMWVFARGRYEITKEKKDGFYCRLESRELTAEYRLIHTKDKDWLVERVDKPQIDWVHDPIEPMLAHSRSEPFDSPDFVYEVKWDGIRAMIAIDEGQITIRSRNQQDITKQFPELHNVEQSFRASSALFDGEIVCLDEAGKPVFQNVIRRMQQSTDSGIARLRAKHPAVCYLFDCLYLDGRPVVNESLIRRREWLADSLRPNQIFRVSQTVSEGRGLYEAAAAMGLEGIVAKRRDSTYFPGKRSSQWIKVKSQQTADCIIIGYTAGKGDRESTFGAMHLARFRDDRMVYVGKVGTGLDQDGLESIFEKLQKLKRVKRPVEEKPLDDAQSTWVEPTMVCEVAYLKLTEDRYLRAPVFLRLRPDLKPEDCIEQI